MEGLQKIQISKKKDVQKLQVGSAVYQVIQYYYIIDSNIIS